MDRLRNKLKTFFVQFRGPKLSSLIIPKLLKLQLPCVAKRFFFFWFRIQRYNVGFEKKKKEIAFGDITALMIQKNESSLEPPQNQTTPKPALRSGTIFCYCLRSALWRLPRKRNSVIIGKRKLQCALCTVRMFQDYAESIHSRTLTCH